MIEYRDEVLRTNAVILHEAKKLPLLETQSTALERRSQLSSGHIQQRERM
jgi:hypothetical protein